MGLRLIWRRRVERDRRIHNRGFSPSKRERWPGVCLLGRVSIGIIEKRSKGGGDGDAKGTQTLHNATDMAYGYGYGYGHRFYKGEEETGPLPSLGLEFGAKIRVTE